MRYFFTIFICLLSFITWGSESDESERDKYPQEINGMGIRVALNPLPCIEFSDPRHNLTLEQRLGELDYHKSELLSQTKFPQVCESLLTDGLEHILKIQEKKAKSVKGKAKTKT